MQSEAFFGWQKLIMGLVKTPKIEVEKNMALNLEQFSKAVANDTSALEKNQPLSGIFTCACCIVPLQETITGMRHLNDGKFYCSDCYFDAFGKELDSNSLRSGRMSRGA
jgi:hypothetical protein